MFSMIHFVAMDTYCKVFCHFSFLDCFNTNCFKGITKIHQWLVVIKFSSECKSPCPCENGSNGVGRSWFSFLVFTVVTGHSAMCSFSFHCFPIRRDQYRSHKSK